MVCLGFYKITRSSLTHILLFCLHSLSFSFLVYGSFYHLFLSYLSFSLCTARYYLPRGADAPPSAEPERLAADGKKLAMVLPSPPVMAALKHKLYFC